MLYQVPITKHITSKHLLNERIYPYEFSLIVLITKKIVQKLFVLILARKFILLIISKTHNHNTHNTHYYNIGNIHNCIQNAVTISQHLFIMNSTWQFFVMFTDTSRQVTLNSISSTNEPIKSDLTYIKLHM